PAPVARAGATSTSATVAPAAVAGAAADGAAAEPAAGAAAGAAPTGKPAEPAAGAAPTGSAARVETAGPLFMAAMMPTMSETATAIVTAIPRIQARSALCSFCCSSSMTVPAGNLQL